jgi:hypothetical protein
MKGTTKMTWEEYIDRLEMSGANVTMENAEERHFRRFGCDKCNDWMANDVYECQIHKHDHTGEIVRTEELNICSECVYEFHYGD